MFPEDAGDVPARSRSKPQRCREVGVDRGRRRAGAYGLSRLKWNGWLYAGAGALLLRRGVTAHCDVYDGSASTPPGRRQRHPRGARREPRGVNVVESVTIDRPIEELYRFWRNLENLPRFMRHLESVEQRDRHALALAREGTGGHARGVECRDHQRSPEQGDRVALARRLRRRQRRLGQFRRRRRPRDARARAAPGTARRAARWARRWRG